MAFALCTPEPSDPLVSPPRGEDHEHLGSQLIATPGPSGPAEGDRSVLAAEVTVPRRAVVAVGGATVEVVDDVTVEVGAGGTGVVRAVAITGSGRRVVAGRVGDAPRWAWRRRAVIRRALGRSENARTGTGRVLVRAVGLEPGRLSRVEGALSRVEGARDAGSGLRIGACVAAAALAAGRGPRPSLIPKMATPAITPAVAAIAAVRQPNRSRRGCTRRRRARPAVRVSPGARITRCAADAVSPQKSPASGVRSV